MVSDLINGGRTTVSTNGFHPAVRIGDTVFDNWFPEGISYDKWRNALHTIDDVIKETIEQF